MFKHKGSIVKNIIGVTVGNISTIAAGIVVGFLLPKILPIEDYGWYKTFTLYMTYVGFFSLGIIDGIVLKYGGYDYDELDKAHFRSFFKWYLLVHVFFACCVNLISILLDDSNLRIILLFISVNMIAVNMTGYFQQISQITRRFKEYSLRKIIQSILNISVVAILYGAYRIHGRTGFPLLFANLCSTLILTLDRQFVSILFETTVYAKYAFAYNMLSLVTVATSAMSTVLYPTLKRTTREMMRGNYSLLISMVSIIVFGALMAYFPLCLFVTWFLPKYEESLIIFRIVFPGLALSSPITVIMHNFYKAEEKNLLYFKKSVVVLLVSAAANAVAYVIFHSTRAISVASIITMVFWYFFVESYFYREYSCSGVKNAVYIATMMLAFYSVSAIDNYYIGFGTYAAAFMIVTIVMFKSSFKQIATVLRR